MNTISIAESIDVFSTETYNIDYYPGTSSGWRVDSDWPNHCPSVDGFQLLLSLLHHNQLDAFSVVVESRCIAAFLSLPLIPRAENILHIDCAGYPLQPISTLRL